MSGLNARIFKTWDAVPAEWRDPARAPTAFQTHAFLSCWYETLGRAPGVDPLIVEVRDAAGQAVALWPLVLNRVGGLREIGFADAGLVDNCAPLIGPGFPFDAEGFSQAWRATLRALPRADLLRAGKMPASLEGKPNPMIALPGAKPGPLARQIIAMPETFEAYSATRGTKFSKEQRRVWRVFIRNEDATFEFVTKAGRARFLFEQFQTLQENRMREIGVPYKLGAPSYRAFSEALVERGMTDGSMVFGALTAGDELIGGLIGLSNKREVAFTRICFAPGKWTVCSPGRLVLEKTMEALLENDMRRIDLSIGDFPYKSDFMPGHEPLYSLVAPLSLRGRPAWAANILRQELRKSAWARRLWEKWRARKAAAAA